MDTKKFTVNEKEVTLYPAKSNNRTLVVLNTYIGDGSSVMKLLCKMNQDDFNLLVIGNLNWNNDMTPWYCPPLSKNDVPFTGGADKYLNLLLSMILPKANNFIKGTPSHICIVGYSLAGLFALYSMYKCDVFDCAASMSGSMWFPEFKNYVLENSMMRTPEKVYLSIGDKEAKTKHPLLKTVQENTEIIAEHFRQLGIDTEFELNPGNHFKDSAIRSAKGIKALIRE